MDERNSTISLEVARNGSPVPTINGIYLHSIYDPEKEADAFVETYERQLTQKNHVLILGLGFGYHVEKISRVSCAQFIRHLKSLFLNQTKNSLLKLHK